MAENDAIIKKLSATPDEFRATAERTGCALLKRFSKDSGLEKGVKEGFNYYNFGLLKEDLGDLATQLKKHASESSHFDCDFKWDAVRLITAVNPVKPAAPPENFWILPLVSKENQIGQPVTGCEISNMTMTEGDVFVVFSII